jgi:hypothetical protein
MSDGMDVGGLNYAYRHIASFDPGEQGLLGALLSLQHENNVTMIEDNLKAATRLLAAVAAKLEQCYTRYQATEDDQVVAVGDIFAALGTDPAYQHGPSLATDTGLAPFPNDSPYDRVPVPWEGIPEWIQILEGFGGDLISPSWWSQKVCQVLFGTNPLTWLSEKVMGDFRAISTVGDAIKVLGEFYAQTHDILVRDTGILFHGWTGVAADSAQAYFRELNAMFGEQSGPYSRLGALYVEFAQSASFGATGLVQFWQIILDEITISVFEAVFGVAAAETGPVDVGILAVIELYKRMLEAHALVVMGCNEVIALIMGVQASCSRVSLAGFRSA